MRYDRLVRPAVLLMLSAACGAMLPAQGTPDLAKAANALTLRSIGPALMSGRIADLAVHPTNRSTWYVAAGSGGLWKTTNAGMIFTPIFDDQPSYSIGVVTLDPNAVHVTAGGSASTQSLQVKRLRPSQMLIP